MLSEEISRSWAQGRSPRAEKGCRKQLGKALRVLVTVSCSVCRGSLSTHSVTRRVSSYYTKLGPHCKGMLCILRRELAPRTQARGLRRLPGQLAMAREMYTWRETERERTHTHYMHTHAHAHTSLHALTDTHGHTHTRTHTYTRTHTHTHIHTHAGVIPKTLQPLSTALVTALW